MQNTHRGTQLIGRAALVALLAAPALGAQGRWEDRDQNARDDRYGYGDRSDERRLFTWTGKVDDQTRIYIRGSQLQAQDENSARGRARGRGRFDDVRPLPRREGTVRVQVLDGRGRAYVVQQPSYSNDYTAIVQVRDWQGGQDRYRLVAYFDPANGNQRADRGDVWGRDSNGGVWGNSGGDVYNSGQVLRWSGNVDGDLRISLWRGQLSYNVVSGERPQNVRSSVGAQMTQRTGQLTVSMRQGRGLVQVIEQPSQFNNYTAVVRVMDGQSGFGYYDFDLIWR